MRNPCKIRTSLVYCISIYIYLQYNKKGNQILTVQLKCKTREEIASVVTYIQCIQILLGNQTITRMMMISDIFYIQHGIKGYFKVLLFFKAIAFFFFFNGFPQRPVNEYECYDMKMPCGYIPMVLC